MILALLFSAILIILSSLLLWYAIEYKSYQKRQSYVKNFNVYAAVLNYHMDKAFDMIYKDRILVFSMEGTKPSEEDFKQYSKDFGKLVLRLLGPTLQKELEYLYGNQETLLFIIAEYFNTKSETDEIRQASLDKLMDQELEIEG